MKAIRLRCESLINPTGIDICKPVLSWNCQDGVKQTAYHIIAKDDQDRILLDTGAVASSSMSMKWPGEDIPMQTKVIWSVQLMDENGKTGPWSCAEFETGRNNWPAEWITGNYRVNKKHRYPVDCFKKTFTCSNVSKARFYITACGVYEARINGIKAGNFYLAPGITDYRKRIQYQTYNVTDLLKEGSNEITVSLGDGWYRGSVGAWGLKNQYGFITKFSAILEITDTDGNIQVVKTDDSWSWSNDGPIRFADNKDGEIVIAGMEPSYGDHAKTTLCSITPCASNNVPIVEHDPLTCSLIITPCGKTVLDFHQNIAGYVHFALNAHKGQKIFLRFGEMLDENGELTLKNIQCSNKKITTPLQQVDYTCKDGLNEYRTTFAIFGFQYVEVTADMPVHPENFEAVPVSSNLIRTGTFSSSNPLLDRFVEATAWSTRNNCADIMTDCPTRERHGWTGDAQIFFSTAACLFDFAAFSKKYLRDIYDWQKDNGKLPQIVPPGGIDFYMNVMHGSVGWADAGIIIPYEFAELFNDDSILEEYYDRMKKYAQFMISRCGKWGGPYAEHISIDKQYRKYLVNCGQSYGEWAEPTDVNVMKWTDFASPHPEVSTAYTAHMMDLMMKVATKLNRTEDLPLYQEYAQGCRKAYQALVSTEKYSLDTDRQAQLVRPLAFDLLNESQKDYAKKRLIQALDHYDWRIGTGFLSTPLILDVLCDINPEYAYRLLENEKMPGWLYMSKNGATTIWESWEGTQAQGGIASLEHYSKGAVIRWLFDTMCVIQIDGENHFTLHPVPGGHFTYANAEYNSVFGHITSSWKKNENGMTFTFVIPSNTEAHVILPDSSEHDINTGTHTFTIRQEVTNEH